MARSTGAGLRRPLAARVVDTLRAEIEAGVWPTGARLPTEPDLVRRFGVSRTVIREAVAQLRGDGLVEPRQGVGVFVCRAEARAGLLRLAPLASTRISELIEELELRAAVEIEAAGLAAARASPGQEAEIQDRYLTFARLAEAGAPTVEADFAFHVAVARATNNRRFEQFLTQLGRRTIPREALREALGAVAPVPVSPDADLAAEHRAVAEAVGRKDSAGARAAMRAHLVGSLERYRALARAALGPSRVAPTAKS